MKKILVLIVSLSLSACMNLNFFSFDFFNLSDEKKEKVISEKYESLEKEYFKMLENPISENERTDLEKNFTKFKEELKKIKTKSKTHQKFIDDYINKISLKLQYLEDLK